MDDNFVPLIILLYENEQNFGPIARELEFFNIVVGLSIRRQALENSRKNE